MADGGGLFTIRRCFGRPGGRLLTYCCGQTAGPRRCRCPAVGALATPGKICLLDLRFRESFELVCVKNKTTIQVGP